MRINTSQPKPQKLNPKVVLHDYYLRSCQKKVLHTGIHMPPSKHFDPNILHVASPCPADWEQMEGDDRSRHCKLCKLNVYNIKNLTGEQIESLIATHEGRVCVRMYKRRDGTIITADCPVGLGLKKRMKFLGNALAACLALAICFLKNDPIGCQRFSGDIYTSIKKAVSSDRYSEVVQGNLPPLIEDPIPTPLPRK